VKINIKTEVEPLTLVMFIALIGIIIFTSPDIFNNYVNTKHVINIDMNFYLEIGIGLMIVLLVLNLCYRTIPKSEKVKKFFLENQKYLSPNCISNWRKYGGIPTVILFVIGMILGNNAIVYISIWIFVLLAITDLLDGIVARSCNLTSEKGARLDAEADKWFDLPVLLIFSLFPVFEPIYLIIVVPIIIFDVIGQTIRGKNSPVEAGIIGKAKTVVKFIVMYLMSFTERYNELYNILELEIVIIVLLIFALILSGLSMGVKTKWYKEYARKYLEEYF
jgi:CDP-diacylglycerol--glycerol-3-phosphate 3-phosphatidyltransferase